MDRVQAKRRERPAAMTIVSLVLFVAAFGMAGCGVRPAEWPELDNEGDSYPLRVVAQENREVADVTADDIVRVMRRVGFSDEQILDLGTDLHDALLTSGKAVIARGRQKVAALHVNTEYLIVEAGGGRRLIYNLRRHDFGLIPLKP